MPVTINSDNGFERLLNAVTSQELRDLAEGVTALFTVVVVASRNRF